MILYPGKTYKLTSVFGDVSYIRILSTLKTDKVVYRYYHIDAPENIFTISNSYLHDIYTVEIEDA